VDLISRWPSSFAVSGCRPLAANACDALSTVQLGAFGYALNDQVVFTFRITFRVLGKISCAGSPLLISLSFCNCSTSAVGSGTARSSQFFGLNPQSGLAAYSPISSGPRFGKMLRQWTANCFRLVAIRTLAALLHVAEFRHAPAEVAPLHGIGAKAQCSLVGDQRFFIPPEPA